MIKKWGEDLNTRFFQRKHTHGKQEHEKMLNIINHQRNANQNEISPHTFYNYYLQKDKILTATGENVEQNTTLVHGQWECKLVQPL